VLNTCYVSAPHRQHLLPLVNISTSVASPTDPLVNVSHSRVNNSAPLGNVSHPLVSAPALANNDTARRRDDDVTGRVQHNQPAFETRVGRVRGHSTSHRPNWCQLTSVWSARGIGDVTAAAPPWLEETGTVEPVEGAVSAGGCGVS
jgi:hypothetical protein